MNLKEVLTYIEPYAKVLSKKGDGGYLLMDSTLIFNNLEDSQLLIAELPQSTSTVLCMNKKNLFDAICDNVDISTMNFLDYSLYYPMFRKYKEFSSLSNHIYAVDNLQNIEEVQGFIKMKAKDPLVMYNIDESILLPFFYGIIPATKSDNISMKMYAGDSISSIVKYTIGRNKPKCNIHVYMRLMNMIRG